MIFYLLITCLSNKIVRQSQIVQSVTQDYQYDLSHLLPVCNLLVQGPKITYNKLKASVEKGCYVFYSKLNFVENAPNFACSFV